ncbi:MAG: lipid-A-disaccharide synthase [Ignavibacteriae bacterium]|nr:lipid-A-disaccharide synthase [Ignavibacteriota bacterium]
MMHTNPKIFIIAGEASGDANAAGLVTDIAAFNRNVTFSGIGGRRLQEANVKIIHEYSTINYIGFSNVLKNIVKIKSVLKNSVEYVKKEYPDAIILVDFPGFNLKFAETVRKFYKGKIFYYISPQIWAWHKSRIKKIRKYIDRMLVIFPFEVEFYKNLGYDADYVGHPLIKRIDEFLCDNKKMGTDNLKVTLLPGSRIEEIKRIFPVLADVSEKIRHEFKAEISLIYPDYIGPVVYKDILKGKTCSLIANSGISHYNTLINSDLVITKFGTTTLELGLLGVPFLSVYKAGLSNYLIAKSLSDIKYVSMPNILMKKEIVKELIQYDFTCSKILEESEKILTNSNYRNNMLENFSQMKKIFYETPIPKTGAEIIIEELNNSKL